MVTPNGDYNTTAGALGISVDTDQTTASVRNAGRIFLPLRPFSWLRSFFSPYDIAPILNVDPLLTGTELVSLQGDNLVLPTEPTFSVGEDGNVALVPGVSGTGIDAAALATQLPETFLRQLESDEPIAMRADPDPIPTVLEDSAVQLVVDQANTMTAEPFVAILGETSAPIESSVQRGWLRPSPNPEGGVPVITVDSEAVLATLKEALATANQGSKDASFTLGEGGAVLINPSQDGTGCCSADAPELVLAALQSGQHSATLTETSAPADFTTAEAQALGITQPIGGTQAWPTGRADEVGAGFTTFHASGESRVTNIHRIADLVRGAIILPGETFSVNDHVGRRTRANGFVEAGAIANGEHVSEVGGGVSQFATTLFNAAYFSGLEIPVSQAHSEYFSRYPRGREATMGFPNPDLQITNTTPYGVMIWTSYTATSLTITLYSTPFATGEQINISESSQGNCARVRTTRRITYVDGREPTTDEFGALYRPGPGQFC